MSDYQGTVLMIVNTASACGFTPQLQELQELRNEFSEKEFEVLGFPSNDFGRQEPLEGLAIDEFCKTHFGVQFPIFEKISVKGKEAHPLFQFLSDKKRNGHLVPFQNGISINI